MSILALFGVVYVTKNGEAGYPYWQSTGITSGAPIYKLEAHKFCINVHFVWLNVAYLL